MHALWNYLTILIDKTPSNVKVSSRLIAYIIDWAVGGIFAGIPSVLIYAGVTKSSKMFSNLYVFPAQGYGTLWSYIAGILCVLFGLWYYVYVPYKIYPGQTLGKHWCKLEIKKTDGTSLTLKDLLIRQFIGLTLLEGVAITITRYIWEMLTLATSFYIDSYISIVATIITMISMMLVIATPSSKALHDYLSKTSVCTCE
ncbi:RDD family protein [Ligilactobacillus sp. Marseille-Q7487]|uniref:RDD family protein n=1 Tax=Ligilactobacillus sp. Marseille-Q7487 TaxID=3022128 RepID=UPI0024A901AB|nr:RDD family protein [Ligilactobacillus sp. Marseille-Q7487]